MIRLGHYYQVKPTIFPDKTSQVWNIPEDVLKSEHTIYWDFENEGELIHVLQLAKLSEWTRKDRPHLIMPFLPYSRQDKEISNTSTFAREIFVDLLKPYFFSISSYDVHSKCEGVASLPVNEPVTYAIEDSKATVICFPDKGASFRGYNIKDMPFLCLDKKRNQATGEIEGLKLADETVCPVLVTNKRILIVDDICDGGRTFIEAAKLLYACGAKEVSLYTTHGIYSKGKQVLFDAGINKIYNLRGKTEMVRQVGDENIRGY